MKKSTFAGLLLAACMGRAAAAAPVQDNAALQALYNADVAERNADKIDWTSVTQHDTERRRQVEAMLEAGSIRTGRDFYHAAWVFQHGQSSDDHALAFAMATISRNLAPEHPAPKWLFAASFDRYLVSHNMPQWYGTQSKIAHGSNFEALDPVDPKAVSDEERVALSVPRLAEAQAQIDLRNKNREAK